MRTGYQMNGSKGDTGDDKDGCNGSHLSHRAPERKLLGGLLGFCILYGHENEMYKEPMNLKRGKGVYMRELRERGGRTEDKTKCAKG